MKKGTGLIILKGVLIDVGITFLLILIASVFFWKMNLTVKHGAMVVLGIYVISNFLAGYLGGKMAKNKKFVAGLLIGLAYSIVLFVLSLIFNQGMEGSIANSFATLALCMASGMFGGMVS